MMISKEDDYKERISFFQKSSAAKEEIARSENERLKLEFELDKLLNSDEAINRAKAIKLKEYYTKLCNDEEKSFKRNQSILNDLQRIDTQFQQLETKLERLSNLKKECETYMRSSYPSWVNENKILSNESNDRFTANRQTIDALRSTLNNAPNIPPQSTNKQNEPYDISTLLNKYKINHHQPSQEIKANDPEHHLYESVSQISENYETKSNQPFNVLQNLIQSQSPQLSQKPSITNKGHPPLSPPQIHQVPSTSTVQFKLYQQQEQLDQQNNRFNSTNQSLNLLKEYERELKRQDTNLIENTLINSLTQSINLNQTQQNDFDRASEYDRPRYESIKSLKLAEEISALGLNEKKPSNEPDEESQSFLVDDNRELYSQVKPRKNSLRQELNLNGLYHLMDYIELEMGRTIHPENFYRQVAPHYKNKLEIIKLGNESKTLNEMDPTSVSMVILDQLPNVIKKHTRNKCLFTSDLMGFSVADINEQVVLDQLKNETEIELWSRLLKHLHFVKRFAFIDANTLACIFAPLLLEVNSVGHEKAIKFLEKIINSFGLLASPPPEKLNDTNKSLTETSMNNQDLLLASSSKLKESSVYQDFIMNMSNKSKEIIDEDDNNDMNDDDDDDDDDDSDDIDKLVMPKSTTGSNVKPATLTNNYVLGSIVNKSPRNDEYDFSQSSISDSQKKNIKKLSSMRSTSKDKKVPAHLRDLDSSDYDSIEESSEKSKSKSVSNNAEKTKNMKAASALDMDFDFYN